MTSDDAEDSDEREPLTDHQLEAMWDAAHTAEAEERAELRERLRQRRDAANNDLDELQSRDLPATAREHVDQARRLLDGVDIDEEAEWFVDDRGDPPFAVLVCVDAEERLDDVDVLIARARVAVETMAPSAPTWEELAGRPPLFSIDLAPTTSREARRTAKASTRVQVMWRARNVCEVCRTPAGDGPALELGHILSLEDGIRLGVPAEVLNSAENLVLECRDCNRGHGKETLPLWLAVGILKARSDQRREQDPTTRDTRHK